jgi:hypothetical protein
LSIDHLPLASIAHVFQNEISELDLDREENDMRRFSISTMMAVIVVSAVGLAAIRNCSAVWAGAMYSITFFTLICSLLGIVFGRNMRRTYWSGFAVLGWGYLFLLYVPWLYDKVGGFLLAPNLFAYLEEILHANSQGGGLQSLPIGMLGAVATGGGFSGPTGIDAMSDCVRIGVAMEALLWAALGGYAACYFASGPGGESNRDVAGPTRP